MSDDELKLLFQSLKDTIFKNQQKQDNLSENKVLRLLVEDTLKFRDKMKESTGTVITVADTREALRALETHLEGEKFPKDLSAEQKALAQILIDRVILFKHNI